MEDMDNSRKRKYSENGNADRKKTKGHFKKQHHNKLGTGNRKGNWNAENVEVKDGVSIAEYKYISNSNKPQKFPGRKVLDPKLRQKYTRGTGVSVNRMRRNNKILKKKLQSKESKIKQAEEETARAEVLLTESSGLLEAEEGTYTAHITQTDVKNAVDITSAAKSFDLKLNQFGPYKMKFTRNGRHLLLGGRKGHLASFDWMTKRLHFEINVMESIHDVCWLHTDQMMAVAQKKWVYMYDNQGVEIHCLKRLNRILKMEFLPYHFLLCTGSENGYLSWLDVSLGREIIQTYTKKGRLEVMSQNPYNGVMCCGHPNGTVTMWTPNVKTPVASVLCHSHALRAIEFDPAGRYFATAGVNREIKIWDARNLGDCMHTYRVGSGVSTLSFSQKKLLSVATGNVVEVYDRVTTGGMSTGKPYMQYRCDSTVTGLEFCPYEDVLGVSTYTGYSSLLIPGAGEPNFDALESNPYMSSSARRETEVKALLGKVPLELITLDPLSISQVDVPRLQEKLEAKRALMYVKVPKIDVKPRYRMKGKSGSAKKFKRKQISKEDQKRQYLEAANRKKEALGINQNKKKQEKKAQGSGELLDRFRSKAQS